MTYGCNFNSAATNGSPDYVFRCSCCIRMIPETAPVYMRDDLTYCSSSCRDRGLSRLFVNLKQSQLEGPRLPSGGSLQTASNYKSESSLATKTERTELTEETDVSTTEEMDWGRLGRLAKIGQRVIDALLKRVASKTWGAQVLRTYSTSVLWGREVAENSAVAPLFNYLPQVDQYMQKDLSFDMSPRSDAVDILDIPMCVY